MTLLQLMEKLLSLEIIRNLFVVTSDDFVNLFLPAGLRIPADPDSGKELAERDLHHGEEMIRDLKYRRVGVSLNTGTGRSTYAAIQTTQRREFPFTGHVICVGKIG
jgi:hypothetical protein